MRYLALIMSVGICAGCASTRSVVFTEGLDGDNPMTERTYHITRLHRSGNCYAIGDDSRTNIAELESFAPKTFARDGIAVEVEVSDNVQWEYPTLETFLWGVTLSLYPETSVATETKKYTVRAATGKKSVSFSIVEKAFCRSSLWGTNFLFTFPERSAKAELIFDSHNTVFSSYDKHESQNNHRCRHEALCVARALRAIECRGGDTTSHDGVLLGD